MNILKDSSLLKRIDRAHKNIYMKSIRMITGLIIVVIITSSCEDPIEVELENGGVQLVIDAWMNDQPIDQQMRLSLSQPYFDSSPPQIVRDASIIVRRDDGEVFAFEHSQDGIYVWSAQGRSLGDVDNVFTLDISYDNLNYSSVTTMNRVPTIDSIGIEFRDDEIFSDDGYYAQFFARDPMGKGDTYWVKTFHNGTFLSKSQELNIAFDAGLDAGAGVDGLIFIPPIREFTNRLDENLVAIPYELGDTVTVELHSISNQAFNFLEIARDQINNGDNGIFSIPLANARGNISASDGSLVLGIFNISGVSTMTRVVGQ